MRLLRSQVSGDLTSTDHLVHEWMRLFNLDRGAAIAAAKDTGDAKGKDAKDTKVGVETIAPVKEREKKPSRKAQTKFEELRFNDGLDTKVKKEESNSVAKGESKEKQVFKLTANEVYEVFKHGSHYLREAVKPEVQRTELNRIELLMPKKLVDTVMMLVNANLKMLLNGKAQTLGLLMLRNVAVTNQQASRRRVWSVPSTWTHVLRRPSDARSSRRARATFASCSATSSRSMRIRRRSRGARARRRTR